MDARRDSQTRRRAPTPAKHGKALVLAVVATALADASGQQAVAADEARLLREITRELRRIEACAVTLDVSLDASVHECDGKTFDPPRRVSVRWKTRGGRTLAQVAGMDLDEPRPDDADRHAARLRLMLPGGVTESLDQASGAFARDQRAFAYATPVPSDLGPGDLLFSFCGTLRSAILGARAARIVRVDGVRPRRVVTIDAVDRAGTQKITFACAEDWGFLPRLCLMAVRRGGAWVELRRVEILTARRTRLGWFPRAAALVALRPDPGRPDALDAFRRLRVTYELCASELADVLVPASLVGSGVASSPAPPGAAADSRPGSRPAEATPLPDHDPIFGSASPLFREPIAHRAEDLEALLAPLAGLIADPDRAGSLDPAPRGLWLAAAVLSVGFAACIMRRPRLLAAVGVTAVVTFAGLLFSRAVALGPGPSDAVARLARMERLRGPAAPPSKVLCGVDCLYLAAAIGTETRPDYAHLARLVRPGAQGTTLETLRIVAECLGERPRILDPRGRDAPPRRMIAHVAPRHFVVVVALEDGRAAVIDPGRGAWRAGWVEIRGLLSPVALAFHEDPQA